MHFPILLDHHKAMRKGLEPEGAHACVILHEHCAAPRASEGSRRELFWACLSSSAHSAVDGGVCKPRLAILHVTGGSSSKKCIYVAAIASRWKFCIRKSWEFIMRSVHADAEGNVDDAGHEVQ